MPSWKTIAGGCLMFTAMVTVGGGCVISTMLFGQAVAVEGKPNSAMIAFALTIAVATLLILAARAITKEPEE